MSLREWVKRLYRSTRLGSRSSRQVWQGIYSRYGDVPTRGSGFDSGPFLNDAVAQAETLLAASKHQGSIPTAVTAEHSLLPLLVSLICKTAGGAKVLDFGGGLGAAYLHLVNSVLGCGVVEYHLVEREAVCAAATQLFQGDSHVQCHASLPDDLPGLDVVHVSSALQYIEDYAALLRKLCAYRAKYVLFVKLSSGDIPTYASQQTNVPGTTLAYWFINIREVIALMSQGGYALIFKGALEREYDQHNFPSEYRLGRACNLLFART